MRFTNICGMTIPERMVALQEMMQELIDAINGEYRWTANVSHVSSTNVFTATNIINFDNSDFIIGQTVLFTDGYLGVVVEVDNSVTPKQFTAGYYMQLKGDKGDNGINGTNGKDGRDALVQNRALSSANITSPMAIPIEALNRTAVLGEPIVMFVTDTTENKTYMLIGSVTKVGIPDVNPYTFVTYSSKVDITGMVGPAGPPGEAGATGNGIAAVALTYEYGLDFTMTDNTHLYTSSVRGPQGERGPQGQPGEAGQGLVKRYMHTISYYEEGNPHVKFNIFLPDDTLYGTLDEFVTFFTENHYDNADTSYPATGFYEDEGVIYDVWGIYYSLDGVYYVQYGNNRNGVDISTNSDVYDIVVDLGS